MWQKVAGIRQQPASRIMEEANSRCLTSEVLCLLPAAAPCCCCQFHVVWCLLPIVLTDTWNLMSDVCSLLPAVWCLVTAAQCLVWCLITDAWSLMSYVWCLISYVFCLMSNVCCLLFAAWCLLQYATQFSLGSFYFIMYMNIAMVPFHDHYQWLHIS